MVGDCLPNNGGDYDVWSVASFLDRVSISYWQTQVCIFYISLCLECPRIRNVDLQLFYVSAILCLADIVYFCGYTYTHETTLSRRRSRVFSEIWWIGILDIPVLLSPLHHLNNGHWGGHPIFLQKQYIITVVCFQGNTWRARTGCDQGIELVWIPRYSAEVKRELRNS